MWLNLDRVHQRLQSHYCGRRLLYITSTPTTMLIAREEAEAGAPEGTAVLAEEQTAGRGRFDRRWVSPAGANLYLTLVLRPDVQRLRSLGIVTPLAMCLAIESVSNLRPSVKWPNDVMAGGKKLAGALIESEMSGEQVRYALVGIGVNVNYRVDDPEIASIATSVLDESGAEVSREDLLAALLNRFEDLYERLASSRDAVVEEWRGRLDTLGRDIEVTFRSETYKGRATDVDAEGNLVLTLPGGEVMTLEAGEVSLRGYSSA